MNRSFGSFLNMSKRVGRLFGVPIDLHISLLFFLLPVISHRGTDALFNFEAAVLIVISILLHELGHALTAKKFGLSGLSITLHGFGGFAMSRGARTWKQQLFISLAGPAVTLVLGLICILIARVGLQVSYSEQFFLIGYIGVMNIIMFFINLVPTLPWDGGQALQAAMTPKLGEFKAMRAIGHIGLVASVLAIAFGLIYEGSYFPIFGIIGLITSYTTLANSGGIKFGEFAADRRARKEMEAVRLREKAKKDEYIGDVVMREKEREANERLRRLLGDD